MFYAILKLKFVMLGVASQVCPTHLFLGPVNDAMLFSHARRIFVKIQVWPPLDSNL